MLPFKTATVCNHFCFRVHFGNPCVGKGYITTFYSVLTLPTPPPPTRHKLFGDPPHSTFYLGTPHTAGVVLPIGPCGDTRRQLLSNLFSDLVHLSDPKDNTGYVGNLRTCGCPRRHSLHSPFGFLCQFGEPVDGKEYVASVPASGHSRRQQFDRRFPSSMLTALKDDSLMKPAQI